MAKGHGGMGTRKHRVSGTVGPNRRALQALGREVNRIEEEKNKKKRKNQPMYDSVKELMEKVKS